MPDAWQRVGATMAAAAKINFCCQFLQAAILDYQDQWRFRQASGHDMGMKELGEGIKASKAPPKVAFLGFDLWLEVFCSGKIRNLDFKKGGVVATAEEVEDEKLITIPMPVVGRNIVISFDPTLGPDEYRLVS